MRLARLSKVLELLWVWTFPPFIPSHFRSARCRYAGMPSRISRGFCWAGGMRFTSRRLIKTPFVALPNILAGRALVPEFLQDDATPENLAVALIREMRAAIDDPEYLQRFRTLRESLVLGGGADMEAGRAVHRFLAQGNV